MMIKSTPIENAVQDVIKLRLTALPGVRFGNATGRLLISAVVLNAAVVTSLCYATTLRFWLDGGLIGFVLDGCFVGWTLLMVDRIERQRRLNVASTLAVVCTVLSGLSGLILAVMPSSH